jgi:hypothetical protein
MLPPPVKGPEDGDTRFLRSVGTYLPKLHSITSQNTDICLQGLKTTMKIVTQVYSRPARLDLNLGPSQYEAGGLQQSSVTCYIEITYDH